MWSAGAWKKKTNMEIKSTKVFFEEMKIRSEEMKRQFASMVLLAPQILEEKDLLELRGIADEVAANFETISSYLYSFGRLSASSKKWIPQLMVLEEDRKKS